MSVRSINFFLCSLCIHCTLFWLLWQEGTAEYGVAPSLAPTSLAFTARIVTDEKTAPPAPRQVQTGKRLQATTGLPILAAETPPLAGLNPESIPVQDYVTAGSLTRLPVPVTDIDLNVAGINDIDVTGTIELTVLVDRIGLVDDVIATVEMAGARVFAERVAQLFRNARFIPGEINGTAVKSQLRLTVISEKPGAPPIRHRVSKPVFSRFKPPHFCALLISFGPPWAELAVHGRQTPASTSATMPCPLEARLRPFGAKRNFVSNSSRK